MVKVKAGEVYDASIVRSGESANGAWKMVVVKSTGKDRKEITIFATNPDTCGIEEGMQFRVDSIQEVTASARKDNRGEWHDTYTVNATVSAAGYSAVTQQAFKDIDVDDGELPF